MNKSVDIVLCEDNKRDADLAMRALDKHKLGNKIIWLKNGEEALDYLFARGEYKERSINDAPKLILLDLKMPKVDGIEVLKKVRNNPHTKNIPVVVLTSSKQEKDIVKSYDHGVNSYIVKPVDFKKFIEAVADVGYYWVVLNQQPEFDLK